MTQEQSARQMVLSLLCGDLDHWTWGLDNQFSLNFDENGTGTIRQSQHPYLDKGHKRLLMRVLDILWPGYAHHFGCGIRMEAPGRFSTEQITEPGRRIWAFGIQLTLVTRVHP